MLTKIKLGQEVKVKRDPNQLTSGCPVGIWKISGITPNAAYIGTVATSTRSYWVFPYELFSVTETKKEILSNVADLEIEIAKESAKLKWMEDNDEEVFSEDEFKIYEALSIIESSKDKKSKVKALKSLLD